MRRYLRVLLKFINLSWMINLEYRTNFIIWGFIDVGWTVMDLIFFSALISQTKTIGTWSYGEMLVLIGLSRIMVVPVWAWMYQSFSQIPRMVSRGDLDLILTKPVDSQFLASTRYFSFSILPSLVGGTIIAYTGFKVLNHFPSLANIIGTVGLLIITIALAYGMYFSSVALTLYFNRLNNIHQIFTHLFDNAKYPPEIFPLLLQRVLTSILPLCLMLIVPASYLVSRLSMKDAVIFFLVTIFFLVISRLIWTNGLRRYSSASS